MTQFQVARRAFVVMFVALIAPLFVAGASAQETQPREVAMGAEDAPVTVIEYMSLTCPHCANFHTDVLPDIMKTYVDTGKVRIIFRDFPLDGVALQAAVVTQCMAEAGPKRYYGFVQMLFQQQGRWARDSDPIGQVGKLARLGGINQESFESCLAQEDLITSVLRSRQQGESEFDVQSTPSFVVNGRLISGGMSFEEFSRVIDPLIN